MKSTQYKNKILKIIFCALFAALTAVGAFIRIPIPAIPITLQTFFVMMAGLLLGPRLGAVSQLAYVAIGLLGLPVFTQGGGIGYVFQPTFGYLIGFCIGAYITGVIAYKAPSPSYKRLLAANFAGLAVVYIIGMIYVWVINTYYVGTGIGLWALVLHCFILVIPGDIVLCFIAALLAKRLIPAISNILPKT
ncbi:MAG: biotin transporter BioY [Oscillospiraceae bacterium]|nr:biotin transporter BioY [Oscillospiraceae bacterium]